MGKYTNVLVGLEAEVRGDESFRERVDELKKKLDASSSAELANAYGDLRLSKENLEKEEKDLNLRIAAVEEVMWSKFEDERITSLKLVNGRTVRIEPSPVASVIDHEALQQWVRDQGLQRLLKLPWQTLNSISKERLLAGEMPPAGVTVKARTKTVYSK